MSEEKILQETVSEEGGPAVESAGPAVVENSTDTSESSNSLNQASPDIRAQAVNRGVPLANSEPSENSPPPTSAITPTREVIVAHLTEDHLTTYEIAAKYNITEAEVNSILQPQEQTLVVDLSDEDLRAKLRTRVLKISHQLTDKIAELDTSKAKEYKIMAEALAILQNGIANQLPKITLENNSASHLLLEELGAGTSDESGQTQGTTSVYG